jgi:RNA polymerase sigma factor (sigma-70 family)
MATAQLGTLMRHLQELAAGCARRHVTDRQLLENFASRGDEHAFASLVQRHGPMVLRVCRRVLRHEQDAEDAFQAAFLVLARHPESIRRRDTLASWLYGVAYRTAMNAKRRDTRRKHQEARLRDRRPPVAPSLTWDDVQTVLDEEIQRLPESYRSAFVLCVLDAKTVAAAAAEMGVKAGTLSARLARARRSLRQQLARRGIQLSAVLAALSLAHGAGKAAVPPALAATTIRFGLRVAAGEPAAGVIPAHVADLAAGVTPAMFLTKAKLAATVLLVLGCLIAGASRLTRPAMATPGEEPKPPVDAQRPTAGQPPTPQEREGSFEVRGRVLDPDGQPVAAARLWFVYATVDKAPEKGWATSSPDGRFHFTVERSVQDPVLENPWDHTFVLAAAEGYGLAWARVRSDKPGELTLRLVKDDLPIQGRVIDLQGKPVAGATVRIDLGVFVPTKGDLTEWLKALEANQRDLGNMDWNDFTSLNSAAFATLFPPVQTGADGRFQIKGIGRERVVGLRVEGPTIATQQVRAMTRPPATTRSAPQGAPSDLLVMPTRPVVGVVRDKDTGRPLAGVTVRSLDGLVHTTTDKDGRYRLVGLPKSPGKKLIAEGYGYLAQANDLPYLAAIREVGDAPGLEPTTVDVALKRGVWVKGRILDKATGKPVQGGFEYFCFEDHPLADELPLPQGWPQGWTQKDGYFRTVALPGRGLIAVRADKDDYRMGVGADQIKGPRHGQIWHTYPTQLFPGNYHTIVELVPKPGDEAITCDVVVDPGRTLKGTILGPNGEALAGAHVSGLRPMRLYWKGAEFTLHGLSPHGSEQMQIVHEEKKLAGWLEVRGDANDPVRIRLQPWGSVTGRLVKPDGQPMAKATISALLRSGQSDKDGKFRIDGLVPGKKFGLGVTKESYYVEIRDKNVEDLSVRPGETRDLGDIQVKPME